MLWIIATVKNSSKITFVVGGSEATLRLLQINFESPLQRGCYGAEVFLIQSELEKSITLVTCINHFSSLWS